MPGYSKSKSAKANLVKGLFNLPGTWVYQDITINYSFQGFPTLSIKTEGIPEEDFQNAKEAFDLATNVTFEGITFEVSQVGWSRQLFLHKDNEINIYSISANFDPIIKRKLETGIKIKGLGGGLGWPTAKKKKKPKNKQKPKISIQKLCNLAGVPYSGPEAFTPIPDDPEELMVPASIIPEVAKSKGCIVVYGRGVKLLKWSAPSRRHSIAKTDVIEDGENTETFPPTYQGVELTWDREDEEPDEEEENENEPDDREEKQQLPPRYDIVRVQTKVQTLTEEDVKYFEPPPDTKVLKGLDSVSWQSGPTRRHQVTTLYNGVEMKSYFEIWGFVYLAHEIAKDDGMLFSSQPAKFWQRIEVQNTSKIYEELGLINLRVNGINKLNKKDVRLVVHPDYANFGTVESFAMEGYIFSFQPRVEYLTGTITTGWKVMPLEKEPGPNQSLDDILDPKENIRASVQKPIAIPRADRTAYRLSPARLYYKDEEQNQSLPFQLDFKPFSELEPHVQEAVRWQIDIKPMEPDSLIGVIVPDINYTEPLVVLTETRTTNSFAYAADPESSDEDPRPPLVAGEEGFFRLDRTILEKDKYRESETSYTATDPGYKASLTISRTSEKSGQAPQGESKPIKYDKKEREDWWNKRYQWQYVPYDEYKKKQKKQAAPLPRYYVNSDLIGEGNPTGGNLSFPYAKSYGEALAAAKTSLEIEHCTNSGQQQKKLAWYYPGIRDGDRVTIDGETFRVLSASVTVNQVGSSVKPIPGLVQLTDGTSVTLGLEVPRTVTSYSVKDELDDPMDEPMNPDQGSTPAGDGEAQVKFIGGTSELGDVLEPDATRRRF